jgi:hypothetical protein
MFTQNPAHHHSGHPYNDLISTLIECAFTCESCMAACLENKEVTLLAHCIELCRDCAEVCFLGAKLLTRDSDVSNAYLMMCEEACRLCAVECSLHEDHETCRICAIVCYRCQEACHLEHEKVTLR